MNDLTDAERLALITHEQVRLVNSEAHLLEAGFEDQDAPGAHHAGRRHRRSAEIIPFPKMDDAQSEVVRGPPRRGAGLSRALLPEWPRAAPTVLAPSKKRLLINGTYFSSISLKNCSGTSDIGMPPCACYARTSPVNTFSTSLLI